jgi:hypothetical protein
MFDRKDAENIEKINAFMGMQHRSTPYDLTNTDDLNQAFLLTVAAFMDYRKYWLELCRIDEDMDESLEYYDTATWLNMSLAPEKMDSLVVEAIRSLRDTDALFYELSERAQKNCSVILKAILTSPHETQKAVLGQAYAIPEKEIDAKIEELFDDLEGVELHYGMEENREEFLAHIKNVWGEE